MSVCITLEHHIEHHKTSTLELQIEITETQTHSGRENATEEEENWNEIPV